MEKLQNNFTTPEQSKRLLELGVPKNSANHYYGKDDKLHYIDGTIPYSLLWETGCTPCWSVGRLIEIYLICVDRGTVRPIIPKVTFSNGEMTTIENIIWHIETDNMDFSKLEE